MLLSLALILLGGLFVSFICKKIYFPSLFGMILLGILIGPFGLNLLDKSILNISSELRKIALIIILLRAGLKLNAGDLKKVGRPAILMCFIPACFEISAMIIFAPIFLGLSKLDSAILGSVIAAVSPAVIVPKMIKLIDENRGTKKAIPQMILAGASVDDVFVIVMFSSFTSLAQGQNLSIYKILGVPLSIITGIAIGFVLGLLLCQLWKSIKTSDSVKLIILLALSFLLVSFEDRFSSIIPFASLIAIMTMGLSLRMKNIDLAVKISGSFDKLWTCAEIILFVLLGSSVAISSCLNLGPKILILLALVLLSRMLGVFFCMIKTDLNLKERLFCMLAYIPKATVQAAIGGLALAMGLSSGEIILSVSVVAILITAPLGAFLIDISYKRLLSDD